MFDIVAKPDLQCPQQVEARHPIPKVLWLLAILCSVSAAAAFIYLSVSSWLGSPTVITDVSLTRPKVKDDMMLETVKRFQVSKMSSFHTGARLHADAHHLPEKFQHEASGMGKWHFVSVLVGNAFVYFQFLNLLEMYKDQLAAEGDETYSDLLKSLVRKKLCLGHQPFPSIVSLMCFCF